MDCSVIKESLWVWEEDLLVGGKEEEEWMVVAEERRREEKNEDPHPEGHPGGEPSNSFMLPSLLSLCYLLIHLQNHLHPPSILIPRGA